LPDRIGGGVLSDGGKGFVAHRRDAPPWGFAAADGTQFAKTHPAASTQAPTARRVLLRVRRTRGSRVTIADLLGTRNPSPMAVPLVLERLVRFTPPTQNDQDRELFLW
jgi:hypothetical protein